MGDFAGMAACQCVSGAHLGIPEIEAAGVVSEEQHLPPFIAGPASRAQSDRRPRAGLWDALDVFPRRKVDDLGGMIATGDRRLLAVGRDCDRCYAKLARGLPLLLPSDQIVDTQRRIAVREQ